MADPQQQAPQQLPPGVIDTQAQPQQAPQQLPQGVVDTQSPAWIDRPSNSFGGSVARGLAKGTADIGGAVLGPLNDDKLLKAPTSVGDDAMKPVQAAVDIGKFLWNTSIPGQTISSFFMNSVPALTAFEQARTKGKTIVDSMKAAQDAAHAHNALLQTAGKVMDEFKKDPSQATVRGLLDVAGALATAYAFHGGGAAPEAAEAESGATGAPKAYWDMTDAERAHQTLTEPTSFYHGSKTPGLEETGITANQPPVKGQPSGVYMTRTPESNAFGARNLYKVTLPPGEVVHEDPELPIHGVYYEGDIPAENVEPHAPAAAQEEPRGTRYNPDGTLNPNFRQVSLAGGKISDEDAERLGLVDKKPEPTPRDKVIDAATAKSNLRTGFGRFSTEVMDRPPTPAQVQGHIEEGVRTAAHNAGAENGGYDINADHSPEDFDHPNFPNSPVSIRDAVGRSARAVTNAAKADYSLLDQASGGQWQRFDDQLRNIRGRMSEVAGIDDDAYSNLETKANDIELSQAQMIEDMKAAGKVDPAIADRAVANYKKGMALQDLNQAVRASTKSVTNPAFGPNERAGIGAVTSDNPASASFDRFDRQEPLKVVDRTDPNQLAQRLAKLDDVPPNGGASRLEQALGREGADDLIDHVQNAQVAAQEFKDWKPQIPQGRDMLRKMIAENTDGTTINWKGVQKAFDATDPKVLDKAFKAERGSAAAYISKQATRQTVFNVIKKSVGYGGPALIGEELIRRGIKAVTSDDDR